MKKWMKVTLWMVALSLCLLLPKQTVKASTDYNLGSLKKSGSVTVTTGATDEFDYIKFKAPSSGYVTFTANNTPENAGDPMRGTWFLCNAKRKQISSSGDCGFYDEDFLTFAIAKGKTYYLKVKTYGQEEYQIDYSFTKVKEKTGNHKKSKAATIKKKKVVKGLLMAGEKKADWYKIKLTKKQVLKLTVTSKTYRGIDLEVYDKYGEEVDGFRYFQVSSTNETVNLHSQKGKYDKRPVKLSPGTYYVKVYVDSDSKACGYYSLKWR